MVLKSTVIIGLACFAAPTRHVAAQGPPASPLPQVSFAAFPASVRRTTVITQAELAAVAPTGNDNSAAPGTPFSVDHPPKTVIQFDTDAPVRGENTLVVYRLTDPHQATYRTILPMVEQLQKLLTKRRHGGLDRVAVPRYPIPNAALILQAKTRYFDAAWGSGIFYLASYAQGYGEYPDNTSVGYEFAGLSTDGRYYVAGSFHVEHPWLASKDYLHTLKGFTGTAETRETEQRAVDAVVVRAQKVLPTKSEESFHPPLGQLQRWMDTLTMKDS